MRHFGDRTFLKSNLGVAHRGGVGPVHAEGEWARQWIVGGVKPTNPFPGARLRFQAAVFKCRPAASLGFRLPKRRGGPEPRSPGVFDPVECRLGPAPLEEHFRLGETTEQAEWSDLGQGHFPESVR